jgi:hypothetical protein
MSNGPRKMLAIFPPPSQDASSVSVGSLAISATFNRNLDGAEGLGFFSLINSPSLK